MVKIDYEELPAIFTIEEAIQQESFFQHYRFIKGGEPEKAFEEADHVFTGVARMGGQEHFYLETNACLAIPKPENGEMEVWSSTQNPAETQSYVAQVTGVAANKIVSRVKRMGGGMSCIPELNSTSVLIDILKVSVEKKLDPSSSLASSPSRQRSRNAQFAAC